MSEENTEPGTPEPEYEYIDVEDAEDSELSEYLANPDPEPGAEETEPPQPQEVPQTEDGKDSVEEPKEEAPQQADVVSREEHEKALAQLQQKELFIQRRNNEIGVLRKQYQDAIAQLQEGLDDRFDESPAQATQDALKIEKIQDGLQALEQEEQQINRVAACEKTVATHVKPGEVSMTDMVQCLQEDGVEPQVIAAFQSNPYSQADPLSIIHLAKRAAASRDARLMAAHIQKQNEEIARLKGQSQSVLEKVDRVAKQKPSVTAANGNGRAARPPLDAANLTEMSNAELDEFLKSNPG